MLPYGLIAFLRSHVDTSTQKRIDYALLHLDDIQVDLQMYWSVIESDTIIDLATNAFTDIPHWYTSFAKALSNNSITNPEVVSRDSIIIHEPSFASEATTIVNAVVVQLRSSRMDTIRHKDVPDTPPHSPSTADSYLPNLRSRVAALQTSTVTPPRTPQQHKPRANRLMQNEINMQYEIALLSPYGKAFHSRDQSYFEQQKFLFLSNMAEQLARFGNIPHTDYTTVMPLSTSTQSLTIIDLHEEQQQLQREYITDTGITSKAADTILAMTNEAVLAAATSISGTSSRPRSTHYRGILRPTTLLPTTTITMSHPRPQPKPLNFGLDHRERAMLARQQLAIEAMQDAASVPITSHDARAMLLAADTARSTSWLNTVDDADAHDSDRCPPTLRRLREENSPPPAHCTRSKTNSHDPHRD
jgi:hypothetical protein